MLFIDKMEQVVGMKKADGLLLLGRLKYQMIQLKRKAMSSYKVEMEDQVPSILEVEVVVAIWEAKNKMELHKVSIIMLFRMVDLHLFLVFKAAVHLTPFLSLNYFFFNILLKLYYFFNTSQKEATKWS